jgi:outer membrane protein
MRKRTPLLPLCLLICPLMLRTQEKAANLPDAPQIQDQMQKENPGSSLDTPAGAAGEPLTRQQAEQLALKNNPRISVAALLALAQKQVVRETRSALLPTLNGNVTGVDAEEASRISAGYRWTRPGFSITRAQGLTSIN